MLEKQEDLGGCTSSPHQLAAFSDFQFNIMDSYNVLIKPMITEKVHMQKESDNKVSFRVNRLANKLDVKQAVEEIMNVQVVKVNILNQPGKKKRLGKHTGMRPGYKKAVVTLKEGEKVPFFEM